eukprot:COSAG01_NODE_1166_length_11442_cov_6.607511_3_plen_126_part_00
MDWVDVRERGMVRPLCAPDWAANTNDAYPTGLPVVLVFTAVAAVPLPSRPGWNFLTAMCLTPCTGLIEKNDFRHTKGAYLQVLLSHKHIYFIILPLVPIALGKQRGAQSANHVHNMLTLWTTLVY